MLEDLNACLDHRDEIDLPEFNRRFFVHDKDRRQPLRIFVCQNPSVQVSGRGKGLPNIAEETREKMLGFNRRLHDEPFPSNRWEFNGRDLFKSCQFVVDRTGEKFAQAFELI